MELLTEPMDQINNTSLNKYKAAGKVASKVLDQLVRLTIPGAAISDLCKHGDDLIREEVSKIYPDIQKGIAFPVCVSRNEYVGFNSPLTQDEKINDGDIVKIELGVHVDGFPALVCYTIFVKDKITGPIKDSRADIIRAVSGASKEILSIMKPGKTNKDIVRIMEKYATRYNCNLPMVNEEIVAPGVFSYQMAQYITDGYNDEETGFVYRIILSKHHNLYDYQITELELDEDEVYGIDIVMCTGSGRINRTDESNVYKKKFSKKQLLKLKASRSSFSKFGNNYFPVNVRDYDPDTRFKLGLKECVSKGILEPYYAFKTKEGEYTARVKFTVIVKKKPVLIAARSMDEQLTKLK